MPGQDCLFMRLPDHPKKMACMSEKRSAFRRLQHLLEPTHRRLSAPIVGRRFAFPTYGPGLDRLRVPQAEALTVDWRARWKPHTTAILAIPIVQANEYTVPAACQAKIAFSCGFQAIRKRWLVGRKSEAPSDVCNVYSNPPIVGRRFAFPTYDPFPPDH